MDKIVMRGRRHNHKSHAEVAKVLKRKWWHAEARARGIKPPPNPVYECMTVKIMNDL